MHTRIQPGADHDPPTPGARLFIAVALPASAQQAIADATADLRATADAAARWTNSAAVHLTLRFLGDTPAERVPALHDALSAAAGRVAPFTLRVAGAGAFPSPARARVLWLGAEPHPSLGTLVQAVEDACAAAALGRASRPFRAHLTVGRPRPGAPSLATALARVGFVTAAPVDSFHLMASSLTRAGAHHACLASFALAGPATTPPHAASVGPR